nr:hypothetical protein GCM10020063_032770 [Dactylosporangium thailandense]
MILVTGGLGFIGSHTTRALHDLGAAVLPASRHLRSSDVIPAAIEVAAVDCTDPQALSALGRRHRITAIVHLAAAPLGGGTVPGGSTRPSRGTAPGGNTPPDGSAALGRGTAPGGNTPPDGGTPPGGDTAPGGSTALGRGTPLDDLEQNTASVFAILRAATEWNVHRVVVASTIGIYAGVGEVPWREDAPLPLASPHPIPASKKVAEIVALASGLDVVVARIGGIWGPQGRPASPFIAAPALIHGAAAQIRRGETKPVPIHGAAAEIRGGGTKPAPIRDAAAQIRGGETKPVPIRGGETKPVPIRDPAAQIHAGAFNETAGEPGSAAGGAVTNGGAVFAGDGADILYARDCGAALALLATATGLRHRLYNVGSGRVTTNAEVVAAIAAVHPEVALPLADGASGPIPWLDTARLRAEGWVPSWPLDRAVSDYLDWLAAGRAR